MYQSYDSFGGIYFESKVVGSKRAPAMNLRPRLHRSDKALFVCLRYPGDLGTQPFTVQDAVPFPRRCSVRWMLSLSVVLLIRHCPLHALEYICKVPTRLLDLVYRGGWYLGPLGDIDGGEIFSHDVMRKADRGVSGNPRGLPD